MTFAITLNQFGSSHFYVCSVHASINIYQSYASPILHLGISMATQTNKFPHFVLVPMLAPGHMIPMLDMASLLAARGVTVTLVTTPANAARITPLIDHATPSLRFLILHFPSAEVGLPDGCENIDALPSRDHLQNFMKAIAMLRDPLISCLRGHHQRPSCLINDTGNAWTREVAQELGVPRLMFNGSGCFAPLIRHVIYHDKIFDGKEEEESVVVPGLPDCIEITKAQAPRFVPTPWFDKLRQEIMQVESESDGVVVNSFDDLEPSYKEWYQKRINKKVWTIGPMFIHNTDAGEVATRGNKASIESDHVFSWLDSMKPNSVTFVSFGSLACTTVPQLIEIGLGLEASNHPFIWVIKAGNKNSDMEEWLSSDGFEERVKGRGVIIRGWAPQVMILSHLAVGGFMTHCGWNSTLEGVAAGVPMVTWPHFAEQFLNERLVVEVLRVGVAVGVRSPTKWGVEGGDVVMVGRKGVEAAVRRLMDEGVEGDERRRRVRELGVKAREEMAMGGSSYENLNDLIRFARGNGALNKE